MSDNDKEKTAGNQKNNRIGDVFPAAGLVLAIVILTALTLGVLAGSMPKDNLQDSVTVNAGLLASDARADFSSSRRPGQEAVSEKLEVRSQKLEVGSQKLEVGSQKSDSPDWLDELIEKIWFVESSGRISCPDGDGGSAGGPMQIHPDVIDDVNFYWGTDYTYADRYDLAKAKRIARLYIARWFEASREEIAARIYNGGPRGFEKESTEKYYRRIEGIR
ncbi:MAG: hypothetical protein H8D47_00605 [Planctomycetes bacterium]|nr:hypothetical protein [Planctomycetota bacterium]